MDAEGGGRRIAASPLPGRSHPVVVTDVFMENAPRVALVEDDDVVQALAAQRSDRARPDHTIGLQVTQSPLGFDVGRSRSRIQGESPTE